MWRRVELRNIKFSRRSRSEETRLKSSYSRLLNSSSDQSRRRDSAPRIPTVILDSDAAPGDPSRLARGRDEEREGGEDTYATVGIDGGRIREGRRSRDDISIEERKNHLGGRRNDMNTFVERELSCARRIRRDSKGAASCRESSRRGREGSRDPRRRRVHLDYVPISGRWGYVRRTARSRGAR